jgi:uncharacterized protein YciI
MSKPSTYVYVIRSPRADFSPESMTPLETQLMGEHWVYLQRLFAEGRVIVAGPCSDGAFGLCVFEAASPEEAAQIGAADPAVQGGAMRVEVHPYRVSLLRGRP